MAASPVVRGAAEDRQEAVQLCLVLFSDVILQDFELIEGDARACASLNDYTLGSALLIKRKPVKLQFLLDFLQRFVRLVAP